MAKRLSDAEIARYWAIERGETPEGKRTIRVDIPEPLCERLFRDAALNQKPMSYFVERGLRRALRELEEQHGPIVPPPPTPS